MKNFKIFIEIRYYLPVEEKNKLLKDIAPVLYIQSDCDTPIKRDFYVKELMKYIKIDSYGSCLHNKAFPDELSKIYSLDLFNEKLLQLIGKYKFVIAFENAACEDYITEKLWRPLITGTVPIYLGSPSVKVLVLLNISIVFILILKGGGKSQSCRDRKTALYVQI